MNDSNMPIPLAYKYDRDQVERKNDYVYPRTPPTPTRYQPPVFERVDIVGSRRKSHYISWMSDDVRHHIIAMIGEFVGTLLFLFFALTTAQIANNKPDTLLRINFLSDPSLLQLFYISMGFGTSLAVNVFLFYRISGGMFNPAVTLRLWLAGVFPWQRGILLVIVQVSGAIAASVLVSVLFPGPLTVQTKLGSDTAVTQGFFIELMLTAELVFTILMLAVEKHRATFVAPVGIGLTLFMGHMIAISFTGASMNPARTFGPSVVLGEFVSYHWLYWLAPSLGAIVAVLFYKLLKFLEYETANAGQDDDGLDVYRLVNPTTKRRRNSNNSITSLTPLSISAPYGRYTGS